MISVIIPTHNRRELLLRSARSVLAQTERDLELIVVDDASTDGTQLAVEEMQRLDARVRYERLERNGGACAARNRGIRLARGEYIAFQDSDDVWLAQKLEVQKRMLERTGADIVFCAFEQFGMDGGRIRTFPPERVQSGWISYQALLRESLASTQTVFVRKSCLQDTLFDESFPRLQDWELMLRLSQKYCVYYHADVLVRMYEQSDSISRHPDRLLWAGRKILQMHQEAVSRDEQALFAMLGNIRMAAGLCRQSAWKDYFSQMDWRAGTGRNFRLAQEGAKELLRMGYRRLRRQG